MRSKMFVAAAAVVSWLVIPFGFAANPEPEKTRAALEQWMELRKLISEERNDWRVEKETIQASVRLIEDEIARIDRDMAELSGSANETESERARLAAENAVLESAAAIVSGAISELEARIVALQEMFPPDLAARLRPLVIRIPEPGGVARIGTGERLQNIVGILGEIEKFNRTITIVKEMQQLPTGETAQVRTMYLGLGAAYFTNEDGTWGGMLTPAKGKWIVTVKPSIADEIRAALAVYENDAQPQFVPLPAEIE
ncbi:MAG: DUF3450 family protein [Opitutaceae bacterium]